MLLDISNEPTPWPLSTFRVQGTQADYCGRGRRFGAHSSAESFYPPYYGKIAVFAWFNAGVRVWDIRDPFAVHEVAYLFHPCLMYAFQGRNFRLTDVHGEVVKKLLA